DFSLSLWFPEEFYVRDANSHYSWYVNGISYAYYTRDPQTGEVSPCHSNKTPMVRYTDGTTKPFLQMAQEAGQVAYAEQLHIERGWYCDVLYFPIFAEPGEEGEGGNSAVVDVNLDSYTSLYPNPANESVNVVCSYKIKGYTLVDATGRELLSGKCNANSMALDLSSLQKGVYFIRLQTAKGSVEKKLLVE
ncbi:MAG: T9SS type A sorting domain-containing protein, partial [Candidatus Onthomorpha sp.]|nr:T9SS type A sorting domain-containing protein [Bacteroidales bacterium]MDY5826343.1 T9SS type A sorting domain-containing protein [Candidatus Onthomorpha sp.]